MKYTQYSRLFVDGVTPDHTIMHVQYSNGVAIWQLVLKRMVNTSNIHGNTVNKWCA